MLLTNRRLRLRSGLFITHLQPPAAAVRWRRGRRSLSYLIGTTSQKFGIHAKGTEHDRLVGIEGARALRGVGNMASNDHKMKSIELNEVEHLLRRLLLDVAAYIKHDPPLELRFTGGWVRDKLLGVGSHDIDVAINAMTGYQFGLKMKQYLEIFGNPNKYGLEGIDSNTQGEYLADKSKIVHGLHKIAANPEKSKHLETVTTKVFGLDIDLVNLRKETYSEDSRNPQMEFGTPEEDAYRRDATVNAMFYNLSTDAIEDLTGLGLNDMSDKLIRTPLEPYQTFRDDPLRVLRLIRFASRLEYTIVPEVEQSMMDETIKEALKAKISRERIGVEVEKMLRGPHPFDALQLIDRLQLYDTIFTDPIFNHKFVPDLERFSSSYKAASILIQAAAHTEEGFDLLSNAEDVYLIWLLSAFVPYVDAPVPEQPKKLPLAACVAREGIKVTNKICDVINLSIRNLQDITRVKDLYVRCKKYPNKVLGDEDAAGRDTLGMAIRRWGPTWRNQLMFAMLVEATDTTAPFKDYVQNVWHGYYLFIKELGNLGLLEVCSIKPFLDGKSLAKALSTKPGPWMKEALDVVMAWQLRNPNSTNIDQAIEMVKNKRSQGELTKALARHFLKLTIRPLFAKTQNSNVTAEGRKVTANNLPPKKHELIEDEKLNRPWKDEKEIFALDLLKWVTESLDEKTTMENWPLVLPPLLTLVDDIEVQYKALGCRLLMTLLDATSPEFLARTGLGDVMKDAIRPCLSYLPSLTPEDDSIRLLAIAYPAMLKVIQLSGDSPAASHGTSALIHDHLLPSLSHCSSHPRVVAALLQNLSLAVRSLQLDTVAHLKYLIPTLSEIMAQPFAANYPEMITASAGTVRELILCAWPRIPRWSGEILKGLIGAWLEVAGEESRWKEADEMRVRIDEAKKELRKCTETLVSACEAMDDGDADRVDIRQSIVCIVEAEAKLAGLFENR